MRALPYPETAFKTIFKTTIQKTFVSCNYECSARSYFRSSHECKSQPKNDSANCLVHSVVDALAAERQKLEAVPAHARAISFPSPLLAKRIRRLKNASLKLFDLHRKFPPRRTVTCSKTNPNVPVATVPFRAVASNAIKRDADKTTIARVTISTAPQFWHWRNISWPKLGPRELGDYPKSDERISTRMEMATRPPPAFCRCFSPSQPCWSGKNVIWPRPFHCRIGAWGEGATLLFLFSFSGALEHYALGRTQREIRSLFKEAPKVATVVDEQGREREVPVEQLQPGMRLLIKPGAQFPVDAEIVKGQTAADESNLTGEATPVEKSIGDNVLAGTLNLWGAVEVSVLRPAAESSLQKSSGSSRRRSITKRRRSGSPTSSAPITPTACWRFRW